MGHKDDVHVLKRAFFEGAKEMREALGMETDPQLISYSKLKDEDFNAMQEDLGMDATVQYIKEMEARMNQVKKVR